MENIDVKESLSIHHKEELWVGLKKTHILYGVEEEDTHDDDDDDDDDHSHKTFLKLFFSQNTLMLMRFVKYLFPSSVFVRHTHGKSCLDWDWLTVSSFYR